MRAGDGGWTLGCIAGLAGYGTALLFHLTAPGTTIPAALLAGSLLAEPMLVVAKSRAPAPVPVPVPRGRWAWAAVAVGAALAVLFAAASIAEIALRTANVDVAKGRLSSADSAFNLARALRIWDVDLPSQAMHAFVNAAGAGGVTQPDAATAIKYAQMWERRSNAVRDDEQVVDNRAALLDLAGDDAGAARLLDSELRIDPFDPQLLLLRGVVAAKLTDYRTAVRTLTLANSVDPTNPQGWQDLAVVYQRTGNTTAAAAAQRKAQSLAPH
jgi:tetratricopeptide (TPR) repeat protein